MRVFKDISGLKFGKLTVLRFSHMDVNRNSYFECICDCGKTTYVRKSRLNASITKSCGCFVKSKEYSKTCSKNSQRINIKNLIGRKFGRLLVISEVFERDKHGNVIWKCKCDCGNEKLITGNGLLQGGTISCGCYQKEVCSKLLTEKQIKTPYSSIGTFTTIMHKDKIYKLRSILEALYLKYLLEHNINFKYEPKVFILSDTCRYLPDFYLVDTDEYIEIKGSNKFKNIYKVDIFKKSGYKIKILFPKDIELLTSVKYLYFVKQINKLKDHTLVID